MNASAPRFALVVAAALATALSACTNPVAPAQADALDAPSNTGFAGSWG